MVLLKESHREQAPPYDVRTTVGRRPSRTYNSSRSVDVLSESRPAPSTALIVRNGSTRPRTPLATRIQRRWIKPCINRRTSNIPQASLNIQRLCDHRTRTYCQSSICLLILAYMQIKYLINVTKVYKGKSTYIYTLNKWTKMSSKI